MTHGRERARQALCVIAIGAGLVLTNHRVFYSVARFWTMGRYLHLFFFLAIWALTLVALWGIASARGRWARILWVLLISISAAGAELNFALLNSRVDIETFDFVGPVKFMIGEFLIAYSPAVLASLAKVGLLAAGLLLLPASLQIPFRRTAWLPLLPIALLLGIYHVTAGGGTNGLPTQFATVCVFSGWLTRHPRPVVREPVRLVPLAAPKVRRILLIVDESVRGDFLDLNGATGVTPYLKSIEGRIANFGLAASGNNCSAVSNALLRMGANPGALGTREGDIRAHPTVWGYARRASFESSYLDSQRTGGSLSNYMDADERALVDVFRQFGDRPVEQRDLAAIADLTALLARDGKGFLYHNKRGAHFPYQVAYPPEAAAFLPQLTGFEPARNREKMVNSYKNAVRWSVDHFFEKLLPGLDLRDTVLIYTSDHGQNLLDDGLSATHCRSSHPIAEEALVPLFVLTDHPELKERFREAAKANHNRANHFQLFPTLLELMGYDPKAVRALYYGSLFDRQEASPGFTSGLIFGGFGSRPRWNPFPYFER